MQSLIISGGNDRLRCIIFNQEIEKLSVKKSLVLELDVHEGKKNISIEDVRKLISFISIKPSAKDTKMAVIHNAQNLSLEAQNALLKILEEPPLYAFIVLLVDHLDNLLKTIISRCRIKYVKDSEGFEVNEEYVLVIKKLISSDIGERIDWISANKHIFKDRDETLTLISNWIYGLREVLINDDNLDRQKVLANEIKFLMQISVDIKRINLNSSLAIEAFLVNLDLELL